MKERIFNLYAKRVGELYNLSPEELFKKARQESAWMQDIYCTTYVARDPCVSHTFKSI